MSSLRSSFSVESKAIDDIDDLLLLLGLQLSLNTEGLDIGLVDGVLSPESMLSLSICPRYYIVLALRLPVWSICRSEGDNVVVGSLEARVSFCYKPSILLSRVD